MKLIVKALLAAGLLAVGAASPWAADNFATLRGGADLPEQEVAPRMAPFQNTDLREVRNYPEQPPIIPHSVDNYVVDLRANKCLSCHARARTGDSQAPMVSITHFMNRDGQFLASISPRRYFCNQCHVAQRDVKAPIKNDFVDIDQLLSPASTNQ